MAMINESQTIVRTSSEINLNLIEIQSGIFFSEAFEILNRCKINLALIRRNIKIDNVFQSGFFSFVFGPEKGFKDMQK